MPTQIEQIKNLHSGSQGWYTQYPWFSIGQLINADNEKKDATFRKVAQKAAIYFNNTQRLHYLLHEQPINKSGWLREYNIGVVSEAQEIPQQVQTKLPQQTTPEIHVEQEIIPQIDTVEIAAETTNVSAIAPIITIDKENIEEKDIVKKNEELTYLQPKVDNKNIFKIDLTKEEDKETEEGLDEIEGENDFVLPEIEGEKSELRIRAVLESQQALPLIAFEPYHTIDYFASLGIKVDLKALDDKLGKQLKSFTSWLKTMKRLPVQEDGSTETGIIVVKTDYSLENIVVVTEAMAEVLIKQGKKEQAIEIFQKLSLLHPEKNHYFVAQIEQLKK